VFRFAEIVLLAGLVLGGFAGLAHVNQGPSFFTSALPGCVLLVVTVLWYDMLIVRFRADVERGSVLRPVAARGLVVVVMLGAFALYAPGHRKVLVAACGPGTAASRLQRVEAAGTAHPEARQWARWAADGLRRTDEIRDAQVDGALLALVLAPFYLAVLFCRPWIEAAVRNWTQRFFLRHQNRVASFLAEEEEVKKAFIAYEGWWHPLKVLTDRPLMVVWTSARVILLRETAGAGPPAQVRSIPIIAVRAVRGCDRLLRPMGLSLTLELLNRDHVALWVVARSLGEEMGEALANAVQQLRAIQGNFEGDVVRHLCPYCFAEAGKGAAAAQSCQVCGRLLRADRRGVALRGVRASVVVGLLVAAGAWTFGPTVRAICRGPAGERVILEGHRLRVFSASGQVTAVAVLPPEIRGGDGLLVPAGEAGTLVGGAGGVYLWSGGTCRPVVTGPTYGTVAAATMLSDGRVAVVARKAGSWVLHRVPLRGGAPETTTMSFLPVNPPTVLLGQLGSELLFAMHEGGVARYKTNGERSGTLVGPRDSGKVVGGAVIGSSVRFVDVERLVPWSLRSNRPDLVQTVQADGSFTATSTLGIRRLPPVLDGFLAPPSEDSIRPTLVCRGSGSDLWCYAAAAGRLVRVTGTGEVRDDFCRGRLAAWLGEVAAWHAAVWGGLLLASVGLVLWGLGRAWLALAKGAV